MSESIEFETEKYKFKVYKIPKALDLVQINIEFKPYREIDNNTINEITNMLQQIGKWEILIKTGKALIKDLGLSEGDM